MDFVQDNAGEPRPEETFTHSHLSWSSIIPYLLHSSNTIHGIFLVQSTHWQSFSMFSLQVFFGLPLGLAPSTSYSIYFFTQSLSSFRNTCPYHCSLLCCSTEIMSSNLSLSLNPLLGILSCSFTLHIHLTTLISACWSATSFSLLTGQASLPCNILLCTQLLYSLPLTFNDISLLVSNGTNCLNLFHPIWILSTAVKATKHKVLTVTNYLPYRFIIHHWTSNGSDITHFKPALVLPTSLIVIRFFVCENNQWL